MTCTIPVCSVHPMIWWTAFLAWALHDVGGIPLVQMVTVTVVFLIANRRRRVTV